MLTNNQLHTPFQIIEALCGFLAYKAKLQIIMGNNK